MLLHKKLWVN